MSKLVYTLEIRDNGAEDRNIEIVLTGPYREPLEVPNGRKRGLIAEREKGVYRLA